MQKGKFKRGKELKKDKKKYKKSKINVSNLIGLLASILSLAEGIYFIAHQYHWGFAIPYAAMMEVSRIYSMSEFRSGSKAGGERTGRQAGDKSFCSSTLNVNTGRQGLQKLTHSGWFSKKSKGKPGEKGLEYDRVHAVPRIQWPTEPPICQSANGIPGRMDEIKGAGNAIVPQIAYEIFRAIQQVEKEFQSLPA